jgi:GrpB-like predicted nucleotidyltransferase (UPF0157 family)
MTGGAPTVRRTIVTLVPYDPVWPVRFEAVRRAIVEACSGLVARVEHIGSTAVAGLAAKPVLDLMPGLAHVEDGERIVPMMTALGYAYRGEFGIPGRHLFTRWIDGDAHVEKHNVHAYPIGHSEWVRHLVFRDALRADDTVRVEYEQLKRTLAMRFPHDVETYAEAKSRFVDRVIAARGGPARGD